MTTPPEVPAREVAPRIGERVVARGVTVTWWYTFTGVVVLGFMSLGQWVLWVLLSDTADSGLVWRLTVAAAAGVIALIGVAVILRDYRPSVLTERDEDRRVQPADLIGLGMTTAAGVLLGIATGSWLAGVSVLAFALSVRNWFQGIRWRVIVGLTIVLLALWIAEAGLWVPAADGPRFFVPALFALLLPVISGSSMWWWDIVLELDRAREAESQLSATRERLRLANDVHDLQGHHLQVIALQLELAERLLDRDLDAARQEIARARASVDDARQGTRDLAARFRGVPLPDELENAADLLRSAGLEVESRVRAADVEAPAEVLGPIVRESVTNVLKHGDGHWAKLSLERVADHWVYRIANDHAGPDDIGWGSGLDGMTERAEAVGGDVHVHREAGSFELTVSLPSNTRVQEST